jgi:hypothetical protein
MNRLDSVNIRIGLAGVQAGQAVEAFGLRSIRPSRSTLHLLDYRPGSAASSLASPSLASTGVTISVADSGEQSLTTVQVRHVRRRHLYPRWAAFYGRDAEMLLVEEERDSTRRVLAASFTVRYEHAGPALAGTDLRLADLLTPRQWSFMQDCAPGLPQSGLMHPLGPIPVLSWTISLDRIDATLSRWHLPGTEGGTRPAPELVEVSRRSLPAEAGFLFPALAASMRRRGLDPDGNVPWLETRAAQWSADPGTRAEQP